MLATIDSDDLAGPEFLARLKHRDDATLRQLVHRYLPQLLRAARGAGLRAENADDVVQNVFLTFLERLDDFEGRSHVRTWLFGILYRKISEMRREVQKAEAAEDITEVLEHRFKSNGMWSQPPRATDLPAYEAEVREHLADCLDGISTDQRLAFILREVEDLDAAEICRAMDVSRSNLGVLLFRGRNLLRECLEKRNVTRG
jgi:RNA polymerase sigma-70 factor (ECF subfamily)